VRSDGILIRAGLVELVGYDDDTRFTNAPKILALTEFAGAAMDYGFLYDVEESDGTVVLDEQQFEDFETRLSALETQLESLSDSFREHCDTYKEMSRFVTVELYFELAMVREMLREFGVPVQHMQETREALGNGYRNGADLTETFYEQESK
jgi:ribosomal protein L16 Arg81 hydroxylase